jgi:hypothetical protein
MSLGARPTSSPKYRQTLESQPGSGEGKLLGKLGGGEEQRQDLEALAGWFRAIDA